MRIHTFPPRLMWRVIAIRAASICLEVIHAGSIATRPKSPKEILFPWVAWPFMRPRCIFRRPSLTLFGINIVTRLPLSGPLSAARRERAPGLGPEPGLELGWLQTLRERHRGRRGAALAPALRE